jgi:Na+-translocating ferredoxin:NAD+ oxidoreductase RnfD subunit
VNLNRFFRSPKGLLILVMGALVVVAAIGTGLRLAAPVVLSAVAAAMIVDAPIIRAREGAWFFPDGALLTGLFVAMILSPHEPWQVAGTVAAVAVGTKYLFRVRGANVFNPAALALVATFYVFNTGQSWWGALPELPAPAILLLIGAGVFITRRVNKVPAVLAFLGAYFLLFTITSFASNPAHLVAIYRAPDLHASLFFAFFMVTDPPTSPPKHRDQLIFGALVAVVAYLVFELIGAAYFLLAGLLAANAWEAVRRWRMRRARTFSA